MTRDHFEAAEDITSNDREEYEAQQEKKRQVKQSFEQVFNSHPGKAVMEDIEYYCRLEESIFRIDPYEAAYYNGLRDAGLYIQHMSKIDNSSKPIEEVKT